MLLLRRAVINARSFRWTRTITSTWKEENENVEGSASRSDLQTNAVPPSSIVSMFNEEDLSHNKEDSALSKPAYSKADFEIPDYIIPLSNLHPDFKETPVGRFLLDLGIDGADFERFTEHAPRAFHFTSAELSEWVQMTTSTLRISQNELKPFLKQKPKLLLCPSARIDKISKFLIDRLDLTPEEMRSIVLQNPFVFDPGWEMIFNRAMNTLYEKFSITKEDVKLFALKSPTFLTLVESDKLQRILRLLGKLLKMSVSQISKLIQECPDLLRLSIFGINERIMFLVMYQLQENEIRDMLMKCPSLLSTRFTSELRHVVHYLEAALNVDKSIVRKIVYREPWVFKLDTEKDIEANLAVLKNYGFSRHETTLMLIRCPKILTIPLGSEEVKEKIQFLKDELGKDISSLITYPNYLTFSLKEHILLRVEFMKMMDRMDYKQWPLMKLFGESDEEFCVRHVKTVLEKYEAFKTSWMKSNESAVIIS